MGWVNLSLLIIYYTVNTGSVIAVSVYDLKLQIKYIIIRTIGYMSKSTICPHLEDFKKLKKKKKKFWRYIYEKNFFSRSLGHEMYERVREHCKTIVCHGFKKY